MNLEFWDMLAIAIMLFFLALVGIPLIFSESKRRKDEKNSSKEVFWQGVEGMLDWIESYDQAPIRGAGVHGTPPKKKVSIPIMEMLETGQSTQKRPK